MFSPCRQRFVVQRQKNRIDARRASSPSRESHHGFVQSAAEEFLGSIRMRFVPVLRHPVVAWNVVESILACVGRWFDEAAWLGCEEEVERGRGDWFGIDVQGIEKEF